MTLKNLFFQYWVYHSIFTSNITIFQTEFYKKSSSSNDKWSPCMGRARVGSVSVCSTLLFVVTSRDKDGPDGLSCLTYQLAAVGCCSPERCFPLFVILTGSRADCSLLLIKMAGWLLLVLLVTWWSPQGRFSSTVSGQSRECWAKSTDCLFFHCRTVWVLLCNLICIPSYLAWLTLFLPVYLSSPRLYWQIEEVLFSWMLSIVSCWSWSAGYTILESGESLDDVTSQEISWIEFIKKYFSCWARSCWSCQTTRALPTFLCWCQCSLPGWDWPTRSCGSWTESSSSQTSESSLGCMTISSSGWLNWLKVYFINKKISLDLGKQGEN